MKNIRIEPEFRDLISPPSADERAGLMASIKMDGIRDKVVVWREEGILLDGHTRVEIHRELKRDDNDIPVDLIPFASADEAKVWMIENQFARRNLSVSQRAMLAAELTGLKRGRPALNAQSCAFSQSEAAKKVNVSRRSAQSAGVVKNKGGPEIKAAVKSGTMSVNSAAKVVEVLDKDDQRDVMALPPAERKTVMMALTTVPAGGAVQTPEQIEQTVRRVVDPVFALANAIKADSCLLPMTTACLLSTDYFNRAFSDTVMKTLTLEGCDKITRDINKLQSLLQSCFEKVRDHKAALKKKGGCQ